MKEKNSLVRSRETAKRGFALMDREELKKVSSLGGKISVQSRRETRREKQRNG